MAKFKDVVITKLGLALITATQSGGTVEFTGLKLGNGIYSGTEVLEDMTALKSVQKAFGISGITRNSSVVKIRSAISNEDVTEGYYITEIGLFAKDLNGAEILYAIFIAETNRADYFPPYEEFPQNMTLEIYISAAGVDESVTFTASVVEGVYVTVEDLEIHTKNVSNPHSVTKTQVGLGNVPNVATNDQTPTYTAASSNTALTSGEKLSVAFGKIAKAISSLISHLSDTVGHITSSERTKWNAKLDATATAVNADTVDGYHADNFFIRGSGNTFNYVPTFTGGVGNLEGGEIHLAKAPNSTIMTEDVIIDVVDKSVRVVCQATTGIKILRADFTTVSSDSVLLHTGVSVPVKIQDTAPADTTALWIS